jgi:hypothetical protein
MADSVDVWSLSDGDAPSSNWVIESPSTDLWLNLADADWHMQQAGQYEVVRSNHEMTELWVHVDHAKVHLVHDDGGIARCP